LLEFLKDKTKYQRKWLNYYGFRYPKHGFSFVLGSGFVVTGLQAVFYLFFATLLEPENYGEMSYLITLAGTFSIIVYSNYSRKLSLFLLNSLL